MVAKRRSNNIIVGLDVGTTKVCAIAGKVTNEGIDILAVSSHASAGLKKGVVIDMEATSSSIKKTVLHAGEQIGVNIKEVYIGIAGSHIEGFSSYGAVGIKGKEVTHEDIERAINFASAVNIPLDREILHILPTGFILDGQEGIKDPIGMAGVRLEVKVYIISGAVASTQNLIKCCKRAGLEVVDIILQPLASAEATLTAEERDMGIALVDIGGGTTDVAIYKDGWLRHTAVLRIGGNHFTNDISVGLRLPFHEAEKVKKGYGAVLPSVPATELYDNIEVDVVAIDGQARGIPKKYITEIMQPRGEELLKLIKYEIQILHNSGIAILGAVLTGGSSLLTGFDRMAEVILAMPVRIGYPHSSHQKFPQKNINGNSAMFNKVNNKADLSNPMYATSIGIVLCGVESITPAERDIFSSDVFNKIVNKTTGWFKKIAGK